MIDETVQAKRNALPLSFISDLFQTPVARCHPLTHIKKVIWSLGFLNPSKHLISSFLCHSIDNYAAEILKQFQDTLPKIHNKKMSIPETKLSGPIKGTIYYPKHGKTSMLCLNDQELQKTNKIYE